MLLTDRDITTSEELLAIDSEVQKVALAEKINLEGDASIIRLATEESMHWLRSRLQTFGGYVGPSSGISGAHMAAVLGGSGSVANSMYYAPSNVVITDINPRMTSTIQRWGQYRALYLLFRAALNRNINDRFTEKRNMYAEEMSKAEGHLVAGGLPIVTAPLPRPGAAFEYSGSWTNANVSGTGSSGTMADGYEVCVTYTGAAYQSQLEKGNAESAPSESAQVVLTAGQLIHVDITSLAQPAAGIPRVGASDGPVAYIPVTGWNVWTRRAGTVYFYLQNASPIAIATKTYTLAGDPAATGYMMGTGQYPDRRWNIGGVRIWRG